MHGISDGGVCATSKALDQPAHVRSLVGGLYLSLECYVTIGLLPGCRLGSESGGGGGGGLCGLVWVCACRDATLLEVTCHGSRFHYPILCTFEP